MSRERGEEKTRESEGRGEPRQEREAARLFPGREVEDDDGEERGEAEREDMEGEPPESGDSGPKGEGEGPAAAVPKPFPGDEDERDPAPHDERDIAEGARGLCSERSRDGAEKRGKARRAVRDRQARDRPDRDGGSE